MPPLNNETACVEDNEHALKSLSPEALPEENIGFGDMRETGALSDKCVHHLFEEQAARTPKAVALIYQQTQLSYSQLNERSNQLAHFLKRRDVKKESLVPLCLDRSAEMIIGILGILKAGGAYVPIDPANPAGRIKAVLENINAAFVLCSTDVKIRLAPVLNLELIEIDRTSLFASCSVSNPVTEIFHRNLAYVIYTSGSTGNPKGVMIEHGSVLNYLCNSKTNYISDENTVSGSFVHLSYTFDASITAMFLPLLRGKRVIISSTKSLNVFENPELWKYAPYDFIKITPSHLELLKPVLKAKNGDLLTRTLVIGGEALLRGHLADFIEDGMDITVVNEYGPTEATVGCSTFVLNTSNGATDLPNNIPIGKPIDGVEMYILDENKNVATEGVVGEIFIGGRGVARGYLHHQELTTQKFIQSEYLSLKHHLTLYKTGDRGRLLTDGNIEYLGRKDEQVKIRGYRIELGEIEGALLQCAPVQQSVVVVQANKNGEKRLQSYYVPHWPLVKAKERTHYEQRVATWKEVYEEEYGRTEKKEDKDEEFNLAGRNDSFTGRAIEKEPMEEWLQDITNLILTDAPQNVLEIGCGMGLIFFQLAGKINRYIGTDLSSSAIKQITKRINKGQRDYGSAEFYTCPAHEVSLKEGEQVDTIIINSIAQYFPGEGYMDDVISKSLSLLTLGGRIIIGDVRDNRLLELFKLRLQLQKPGSTSTVEELKLLAEQEVLKEEELCFSPEYFFRLQSMYPQITHIEIAWKCGSSINETTLYRYNVILYVGDRRDLLIPDWWKWEDCRKTSILQQLDEGVDMIALRDAPNPRLWKEKALNKLLQQEEVTSVDNVLGIIREEDEETVSVEEVLSFAERKGYTYRMFLDEDLFKVNMLLEKSKTTDFVQVYYGGDALSSPRPGTNIPLFAHISTELKKEIRSFLQEQLPEYMIPQDFISLVKLPLTRNGKIDRQLLSHFKGISEGHVRNYVAPSGEVEQWLVAMWQEVLQVDKPGINDNFFELGGNSIHAAILFSRVNKRFNKNLPIATLLTHPTIKELGIIITEKTAKIASSSLVPIQPNGTKTPLFCVHAGGGDVLFYNRLSRHLGQNQPLFALQAKGVNGKGLPHTTMEKMANYYINELRKVQLHGPYYLVGYCLGALITFEMAQQLTLQGHKVGLLANLNGISPTYVHRGLNLKEVSKKATADIVKPPSKAPKLNLKAKLLSFPRRVKNKISRTIISSELFLFLGYLLYGIVFKMRLLFHLKITAAFAQTYVSLSLFVLQSRYHPKNYTGSMIIFRSPKIYRDPSLGWKNLVNGEIKTIDIAGDHKTRRDILNEPFVKDLAKELEKFLKS